MSAIPLPSMFMPLPLPMMIPFMGIQSGVMAKMFGENFQFGKRKISAMSNEEFNALTFEKLMQDNLQSLKGLIPTFEQSLADMRPFTEFIIREFGVMIQLLLGVGGNQFDKASQTAIDDFYHFMGWGHANTSFHSDGSLHEGATDTNPPPPPPPDIEPEPIPDPGTDPNPTVKFQIQVIFNNGIGNSVTWNAPLASEFEHRALLNSVSLTNDITGGSIVNEIGLENFKREYDRKIVITFTFGGT